MDYPLALRRTAGLLVLLASAATIVAFVALVAFERGGSLVILAFLGAFILPTLVSVPFLVAAADDVWHGRHEGDRLLFWSLLWAPGPILFSLAGKLVARAMVATVVVALLLYLVGTRSKYDWPDATGGAS